MASATSKRWWLAINGATDGPRTETYIMAAVQSGQLPATTQACQEGMTQWLPLSQWPEFMHIAATSVPPPPPPPPTAGISEPVLTNPFLPPFANWLCVYCIVASPLIWMMDNLTCFLNEGIHQNSEYAMMSSGAQLITGLMDLPVVIVLLIGGLGLRRLRSSGATMIRVGLWLHIAWLVLFILFQWFVDRLAEDRGLDTSMDAEAPAVILWWVLAIIALSGRAFEIAALIWLSRRQRTLPLTQ